MKAIRIAEFGDPEVLQIEEIPDPTPGAGQVVVKIAAVGVNPVDTYVRSGTYGVTPKLPYTPGMDAAGEVESVGEDVTRVAPSDRVYTAGTLSGAYAEKALCAEWQVYPLPGETSFGQGAALGIPYGTAHRALFHRGRAMPGETVLVHGASGGVGIAALQLARAYGMTVIGTGGSTESRALATEHGAHHVFDHHDAGHLDAIVELMQGRGVDLIVEMLADVNLGNDLPALAPGGRVVIVGNRGTVEINPRDLMGRDADVLGMSLINLTRDDRDGIHAALQAGLRNGALQPVVSRELPLAEAPRAHVDVIAKSTLGKIVLIP